MIRLDGKEKDSSKGQARDPPGEQEDLRPIFAGALQATTNRSKAGVY